MEKTLQKPLSKKKIDKENTLKNDLKIKRGDIESFTIFEIKEEELEILEKGFPSSLYLNYGLFLFSMSISFFITLTTCDFLNKNNLFIIFSILTIIGFILGAIFLILWISLRKNNSDIFKKIKGRIK